MATSIDYDAPRTTLTDDDSLEELQARRGTSDTAAIDVDDSDAFELPGSEPLDEEFAVAIIAMRPDEFRCTSCFLIWHRSQQTADGQALCRDCG